MRVIAPLEVGIEQLTDKLPESGDKFSLVSLDDVVRRHSAFAVHQAHQDHTLADGHLSDILLENAEKLALYTFNILVALTPFERFGGQGAVHLSHHFPADQGIGIDFVEIVNQLVIFAPLLPFVLGDAGENAGGTQFLRENRIAVFIYEYCQVRDVCQLS